MPAPLRMSAFLVVSILVCVLLPAAAMANGRVIGGTKADRATFDARWGSMVSIGWTGGGSAADRHSCGGTLVATRIVLTARHCVEQGGFTSRPNQLVVYGGSPSLERGGRVAHVLDIYRPPGASPRFFEQGGDIALLELSTNLFDGVPLAAFARPEHTAWWGEGTGRASGVRVAGWGIIRDADIRREREYGPTVPDLRQAAVPLLSASACSARLPRDPTVAHHLCAGAVERAATSRIEARASCYGDSGGPLLADDPAGIEPPRVIGVVSRGTAATCGSGVTLYTPVAPHAAWIDEVIERVSIPHHVRSTPPSFSPLLVRRGVVTFSPYRGSAVAGDRFAIEMDLGRGTQELARFSGTAAPQLALPPTRNGRVGLRVRYLGGPGRTTAPVFTVTTKVDRRPPSRIARFTARRVGVKHQLAWSPSVDRDDRVVAYFIEQRRVGTRRWHAEYYYECSACWMNRRARMARRSTHILLPGRREFRISAIDRAGNWGPATISR